MWFIQLGEDKFDSFDDQASNKEVCGVVKMVKPINQSRDSLRSVANDPDII